MTDKTQAEVERLTKSRDGYAKQSAERAEEQYRLAAEVERLRSLFKTQSESHAEHVKGLLAQHKQERDIYGKAAQDFRERAEKAGAEVARLTAEIKAISDIYAAPVAQQAPEAERFKECLEALRFIAETLGNEGDEDSKTCIDQLADEFERLFNLPAPASDVVTVRYMGPPPDKDPNQLEFSFTAPDA